MEEAASIPTETASAEELYSLAVEQWGEALERLTTAYEADRDKRRDLSQEIHFQLWRSFHGYDRRCSLRTWTYRVAHHVAASHVRREKRVFSSLVGMEDIETFPESGHGEFALEQQVTLTKLAMLIRRLRSLDRQIIVSWLEGMDAESIGEITGLSAANVAVRVGRVHKAVGSSASWRRHPCSLSSTRTILNISGRTRERTNQP